MRDYTAGLRKQDLQRLFQREAAEAYGVLTRDNVVPEPADGWKRFWHRVRVVFLGLSYKLTPARRVLFAGAMLPGLLLVFFYMCWVAIRAIVDPRAAPALRMSPEQRRGLWRRVIYVLVPPIGLIVAVLGSIVAGVASPTESASVGAVGAMLLAAGNRQFSWRVLHEVMRSTLKISSMVFVIVIGAQLFSLVFRGFGGDEMVHKALTGLPGGATGAMIAVMLLMFIMGFFLDFIEITFVVVPIVAPVLLMLGMDPVWLGIMIAVNLQTSFLTPPFGFALFYLRGVAPPEVTTMHIYRGVIPFVVLQLLMLVILAAVPAMATWLPKVIFG